MTGKELAALSKDHHLKIQEAQNNLMQINNLKFSKFGMIEMMKTVEQLDQLTYWVTLSKQKLVAQEADNAEIIHKTREIEEFKQSFNENFEKDEEFDILKEKYTTWLNENKVSLAKHQCLALAAAVLTQKFTEKIPLTQPITQPNPGKRKLEGDEEKFQGIVENPSKQRRRTKSAVRRSSRMKKLTK